MTKKRTAKKSRPGPSKRYWKIFLSLIQTEEWLRGFKPAP